MPFGMSKVSSRMKLTRKYGEIRYTLEDIKAVNCVVNDDYTGTIKCEVMYRLKCSKCNSGMKKLSTQDNGC
jgi:hypothetical protein